MKLASIKSLTLLSVESASEVLMALILPLVLFSIVCATETGVRPGGWTRPDKQWLLGVFPVSLLPAERKVVTTSLVHMSGTEKTSYSFSLRVYGEV